MFAVYKFPQRGLPGTDWDQKYAREAEPSMDAAAYSAQPFVQTILRHVTPGARLLDAGCGTGGLLWFFRERGLDVAGVDTSQAALEAARRMVPGAVVEAASIEALPFQGASFDAYLAIGSWEYPPEGPVAAAREAARALKPGGLAFIEVPHANLSRRLFYIPLKRLQHFVHPSEVCKTLFGRVRARTPQFSHHLFRIREMHDVLRRAGFDILETRPHDLPEPTRHYGLWVDWPFLRGRPRG